MAVLEVILVSYEIPAAGPLICHISGSQETCEGLP